MINVENEKESLENNKDFSNIVHIISTRKSISHKFCHKKNENPEQIKINEHEDLYIKINEEEEIEIDEENLLLIAKLDRVKFIEKIQEKADISQKECVINNIQSYLKEVEIEFDYFTFFKIFLYHFLHSFLFGPFALLLIIPLEGYKFTLNMGFVGFGIHHLIETLCFISGAPTIIYFVYRDCNRSRCVFEVSEFIFCLTVLMIRFLIIATKYATFSKNSLRSRYHGIIPNELEKRESDIGCLKTVDPLVLDAEIFESMIRNQIDIEFFKISLLTDLPDELLLKLTDINYFKKKVKDSKQYEGKKIDISDTGKDYDNIENLSEILSKFPNLYKENQSNNPYIELFKNLSKFNKSNNNLKQEVLSLFIPGRLIFRELIVFIEENISTFFKTIVYIFVIIRVLIPFFYRFYMNQSILGNSIIDNFFHLINLFIYFGAYYSNIFFILLAVKDLQIRHLLMQSLYSLINPDKLSFKSEKISKLALINIFSSKNIASWLNLRILTMEYGKRYFIRLQIYVSAFLLVYLLLSITFLLAYFKVIYMDYADYKLFIIMGISEIFIFSIIVLRYIYFGAQINKFTETHVNQLLILKDTIYYILQNFNEFKKMTSYSNLIFEKAKFLFEYLNNNRDECKDIIEVDDQFFKETLEKLKYGIDNTISRIEFEAKNRSLKLLEIELNFGLLYRIYGVIFTFLYSFLQVKISKYLKIE